MADQTEHTFAVPANSTTSGTQTRAHPSSSHRLPTVSASQALQALTSKASGSISTNINAIDHLLAGREYPMVTGGFERGKLTEIWGGSGAGKTALALQAAVRCMIDGHDVVWFDTSTPLSPSRLASVFNSMTAKDDREALNNRLQQLHHVHLPSLSHLLAQILHSPSTFPPNNTALIIIDGFNTLLDLDYPRFHHSQSGISTANAKWATGRRYAVLGTIGAALNKLAVMSNLAVVVTTGCATRSRDSRAGLALVPGVGGGDEWEAAVSARLVVFRDFESRFVGVIKCRGRFCGLRGGEAGDPGVICPVEMGIDGMVKERFGQDSTAETADGVERAVGDTTLPGVDQSAKESNVVKIRKRVHDEISDSEGEDADEYGWEEGDGEDIVVEAFVDKEQENERENDVKIEHPDIVELSSP